MTPQLVAVGAATASAATFGLSTSLQHLVSSRLGEVPPHRLMVTLLRTPLWVVGTMLSGVAFGLHAVALARGSLVLVQPVIVTGVVFAVLIRAGLDQRLPTSAEAGWAVATWAGLATFLVGTGSPTRTGHLPSHALPAVAALLAMAALGGMVARRQEPGTTTKGLWLGAVAGVLFGLVAVLLKLVLSLVAGGPVVMLTSWPLWVMTASGLSAVLVNQRAYQSTRLSVSMPVLNIVNVLVALGFAAVVLGEVPDVTAASLGLQGVGLAIVGLGVLRLARLEHRLPQVRREAPERIEPLAASPRARGSITLG